MDEPRGSEAMVAALLVPPDEPGSLTGVIYFDRTGVIGMCGHGTIGLVETFRHLGRIGPGDYRIDTAVGRVEAAAAPDGAVTVRNVPSRRLEAGVSIDVEGLGGVVGDIAYGGNTFFLVNSPAVDLDQPVEVLLSVAKRILAALRQAGFGGRPRRALRPAHPSRSPFPELRSVPQRHLRPFTMRYGDQRQAGVPGRRQRSWRPARSGCRSRSRAAFSRLDIHGMTRSAKWSYRSFRDAPR